MLRRLQSNSAPDNKTITLYWHDREITAQQGDTVASALLLADIRTTKNSAVSDSPRLPFCMMGSCFECLVDIDGKVLQGCLVQVEDEMKVTMPETNLGTS